MQNRENGSPYCTVDLILKWYYQGALPSHAYLHSQPPQGSCTSKGVLVETDCQRLGGLLCMTAVLFYANIKGLWN